MVALHPQKYACFLPNTPGYYHPQLDALAQLDAVDIQVEFTKAISDGHLFFTPDRVTPTEWLEAHAVEVYHYVLPYFAQPTARGSGPAQNNPYFFRQQQYAISTANDWFLKDRAGDVISIAYGGGKLPVIDAANPQYRDWLVEMLVGLGVKTARLDVVPAHWAAYLKQPVDDTKLVNGVILLCQQLRAEGVKTVGNWSWQMGDPTAEAWEYPYRDYMDGAMIELNTGVHYGGKWYELTDEKLEKVLNDWGAKDMILFARYNGSQIKRFPTYSQYAEHYFEIATRHALKFAIGSDIGSSATSSVDLPTMLALWGDDSDSGNGDEHLDEHLRKLIRDVDRLKESVTHLSAFAIQITEIEATLEAMLTRLGGMEQRLGSIQKKAEASTFFWEVFEHRMGAFLDDYGEYDQ